MPRSQNVSRPQGQKIMYKTHKEVAENTLVSWRISWCNIKLSSPQKCTNLEYKSYGKKIKICQTLLHPSSLVSLSLLFSPTPFILRVPLDPAEAGPQHDVNEPSSKTGVCNLLCMNLTKLLNSRVSSSEERECQQSRSRRLPGNLKLNIRCSTQGPHTVSAKSLLPVLCLY